MRNRGNKRKKDSSLRKTASILLMTLLVFSMTFFFTEEYYRQKESLKTIEMPAPPITQEEHGLNQPSKFADALLIGITAAFAISLITDFLNKRFVISKKK